MKLAEREHYGLAVYCAKRFQGRGVPMEELIGEAEAALLWAAARFDESRGVRFSTYAIPVTLGALRDLCRRAQPMHVPRQDVRVLMHAELVRRRLCTEEGEEPGVQRIAQEIGMDAERLSMMLGAQERMRSASGALDDAVLEAAEPSSFEDAVLLKDAIQRMPKPYAQVLWLRCRGYSQAEIARRFGAGQPQVSRWEKQAREMAGRLLG